ncbi:hypothetical protein BGY98DRAFT_939332 [Russula aff. rugulosa BPL654]|nr:hypothetical protein BGY98DRAFT_939332 [Russula aff. rugulosa BPL654]
MYPTYSSQSRRGHRVIWQRRDDFICKDRFRSEYGCLAHEMCPLWRSPSIDAHTRRSKLIRANRGREECALKSSTSTRLSLVTCRTTYLTRPVDKPSCPSPPPLLNKGHHREHEESRPVWSSLLTRTSRGRRVRNGPVVVVAQQETIIVGWREVQRREMRRLFCAQGTSGQGRMLLRYTPSRRLKLEQVSMEARRRVSASVKKRVLARLIRAKAHSHGAIHREQKKKKEWKRGEERDVTGTSSLPASSSSSNSSSAPNTRHHQHLCGAGGVAGVTASESCMLKM